MKLTTPFTILNRTFNEMDLIKNAMKNRKLATERLHNDYRKMFKNKEHPTIVNEYVLLSATKLKSNNNLQI